MKNFTLKFALTLLLGLGMAAAAMAQKIGGVVKDSAGNPVIGASVVVEGTTLGASSGVDGSWTLQVPDASKKTLVVSYIGMKTQRVAIGTKTQIDVTLEVESTALDDVVVVGYAAVKRRDVVGSVASVSADALTQMPVNSVTEALSGRMAGVTVTATEGDPDAEIKIRVRGGGSITQDNSPLYIVDGFPVESISDIPASEIASIDVLKDAFSTAIYGARGANGVVIVTTKSGESGRITVNYNAYYGIKKFANQDALTPMTPYEFVQYQYEAAMVEGKLATNYEPYFGGFADMDLYRNLQGIDWLDQTFGRTGTTFNHNLSISGGGDKFKWTAGYAHIDERAIMVGSTFKRNNLNFKASYKPTKKVSFDFSIRYSDTNVRGAGSNSYNDSGSTSGNGRVKHAIQYRPFPFTTAVSGDEDETSAGDNVNPLIATADNDSRYERKNWNGNAAFQWEIVDNLKLRVEAGLDTYDQTKDRFYGMTTYLIYNSNRPGPATQYTDYTRNKIRSTNTLSYDFKNVIGNKDHSLNLLMGQEYIVTRSNTLTAWAYDFPEFYDSMMAWQMMSSATGTRSVNNFYDPDDRLFSFFGRLNYDYKGKYMFSATMRADGSSKFAKDNQWGYFPSAAVSWRLSGEEWMKDITWIDNLKLRYSYGTAGNNNIPSGLMLQEYAGNDNASNWYLYDNWWGVAKDDDAKIVMANPDLTWETTYSHNLGLDFSFLRGRINGSVDVYQNNTKDLLIKYPLTGSGYEYQYRNLGETRNRGVELAATFVLLEKPDYGLTFTANASYNENTVMDLGGLDFLDGLQSGWVSANEVGTDYRVTVGSALGQMYGYVSDGRYEVDDFNYVDGKWVLKEGVVDCSAVIGTTYLRPGAMKLRNVDGSADNKVTTADRTIIGNAQPKWTGGFSLTGYAYGFDFAANFNWVYGNQIYNANKIEFTTERGTNNKFRNLIDMMATQNRWTNIDWSTGELITDPTQLAEANAGTTMWSPLMSTAVFSDWAVEDGSFLRLSSVTLGYTLPDRWMQKLHIKKFRLYVTGANLFCWTGYSGYDPEVDTRRATPLTPGVDYSAYPRSRSVVFGANLTF